MRAMVLEAPAAIEADPLELREVPEPEPGPGEIVVEVSVCGICRTDLHVVEGELPPQRRPVIPGHQVVGRVAARARDARRFREGDRVGIAWLHRTCGACAYCKSGDENLCRAPVFTGWHVDGGYAERARVPEAFAYALPDVFGDAEASPLLCAGIIGYRALRRSGIRPGGRLGLYGFGSSAHIALQVARHRGCEVYVCTRDERHQRLALELGAVWAGGADEPPPTALDSAILFAPVGHLVPVGLRALRPGGTLACAGIYMTEIPRIDYGRELFEERTLTSVTANTRRDGEELLAVAAEIPLRPRTTAFALADANLALQRLKHDAIEGSGVLEVAPGAPSG
jgi:propanol-preferring alcohol dehydrogenase